MFLSLKPVIRPIAAAACLMASTTASAAGIWIFGDSLTDPGNLRAATAGAFPAPFEIAPDPPYPAGRRTNGNTWANYLEEDFTRASFTNSAVAGALAGGFDYELAPGVVFPVDNLNDVTAFGLQLATSQPPALLPGVDGLQRQTLEFSGTSSARDIGVFWIGANDIFAPTVDPTVVPHPAMIVDNIKTAAREVHGKGIQTLVVGNLPDLGATPLATVAGASALFSGATLQFNALLDAAALELMAELPDLTVQVVDIYSAFNDVLANPGDLGIVNTTDACIPDIVVVPTSPACGNVNEFVFYDLVHPTTVMHRAIADEFSPFLASANVSAPASLWLLLVGAGLLIRQRQQA